MFVFYIFSHLHVLMRFDIISLNNICMYMYVLVNFINGQNFGLQGGGNIVYGRILRSDI